MTQYVMKQYYCNAQKMLQAQQAAAVLSSKSALFLQSSMTINLSSS